MIELDAIEKGYYEVWVNDIKVSQHSKPLKAISKALELKGINDNDYVVVKQPNIEPIAIFKCEDTPEPIPIPEKVKAFPSAYGGGAYATGGRGKEIYHVTNLSDSGIGSFRDAVSESNRTVVFDVSGIIELKFDLHISQENLSILGQSAPEGGITITPKYNDSSVSFEIAEGKNIIMRYISVRGNFSGTNNTFRIRPDTNDGVREACDIILDHVSLNWSGLQGFSVTFPETHNITFQNGLIAECKTGALFGDTDNANYSYDNTFRTTLFYNVSHRTPNTTGGRADIYNNVVYDWKNRLTTVKQNSLTNHFNNYYYLGNRTSISYQWQNDPIQWFVNGMTNHNPALPPKVYTAGNIIQQFFEDENADNKQIWIEHATSNQTERPSDDWFVSEKYPMIGEVPVVIMTAKEASKKVPSDCGNYKYIKNDGTVGIYRDEADSRYVTNVLNDTPEEWSCCNSGVNGNRHSAIESQTYADFLNSINGLAINERPNNFYQSNEHIPEVWFKGNVPQGQTENDIAPSGYTWIEEYLNQVDYV